MLLSSLRPEDGYQFRYVYNHGKINDEMDPSTVVSDPVEVDLEIERTKCVVINEEHVSLFGESLKIFIGMTISNAFSKVKEMNL